MSRPQSGRQCFEHLRAQLLWDEEEADSTSPAALRWAGRCLGLENSVEVQALLNGEGARIGQLTHVATAWSRTQRLLAPLASLAEEHGGVTPGALRVVLEYAAQQHRKLACFFAETMVRQADGELRGEKRAFGGRRVATNRKAAASGRGDLLFCKAGSGECIQAVSLLPRVIEGAATFRWPLGEGKRLLLETTNGLYAMLEATMTLFEEKRLLPPRGAMLASHDDSMELLFDDDDDPLNHFQVRIMASVRKISVWIAAAEKTVASSRNRQHGAAEWLPADEAEFVFDTATFMPKDFKFPSVHAWATAGTCHPRNRTFFSPKPFYQVLRRAAARKSAFDVSILMHCPSLAAKDATKSAASFPLEHGASFVFKLLQDDDEDDEDTALWYSLRGVKLATGVA